MSDKEEIKKRVQIKDYIEQNVHLKFNDKNKICCPFHNEKTPSFQVNEEKGVYYCFGCHKSGDVLQFAMDFHGLSFPEAIKSLAEHCNYELQDKKRKSDKKKKEIVCTYDYCDANGTLKYQVVRLKPKDFRQRRPDPQDPNKWLWNMKKTLPLPYMLPQLLKATQKHKKVFIVGGEKDVHSLWNLGLPATCNHGGEGKFWDAILKWFKDYHVYIIPDNDKPGYDHAQSVAHKLHGIAKNIKIINLPVEKAKEDVTDWIEKYNGCKPDIIELVKQAEVFVPTIDLDDQNFEPLKLHQPVNPFDWPHATVNNKPLGTFENFVHMLKQYGISVRYNVISKETDIHIPGVRFSDSNAKNCNLIQIQSLCSLNGIPQKIADSYLKLLGDKEQYNPIYDWIESKEWDGIDRLQTFYDSVITKREFPKEMKELLMRKWLISCCASAAMTSGYIGKGVLTFQGDQNIGKTTWVRNLVPKDLQNYIKDNVILDPSNKDSIMTCIQHWIVELGELDGTFKKTDPAKLKGFISSNCDVLRRPYERKETRFHRKTTFFASVNDFEFLIDHTGNVRFWVIPVIEFKDYNIDLQQMWAQVNEMFSDPENWWLTESQFRRLEELNKAHVKSGAIEELINLYYDRNPPKGTVKKWLTATQVLQSFDYPRIDKQSKNEAAQILKYIYGESKPKKHGRCYLMPYPRAETERTRLSEAKQKDLFEDEHGEIDF